MATEKLADGIRKFTQDLEKLEKLVAHLVEPYLVWWYIFASMKIQLFILKFAKILVKKFQKLSSQKVGQNKFRISGFSTFRNGVEYWYVTLHVFVKV
jgi:hypothetical protein